MTRHISESDVALFVSGDLGMADRVMARLHLNGCEHCRRVLEVYRHDRAQIRQIAGELPEDLDWNRLASEMTANIRVGLAAGECVAPRSRKPAGWNWRPAAVVAGLTVVLAGSWWLNMPAAQTQELGRAMHAIWNARGNNAGVTIRRGIERDERGPVVEATASGIELRENGSSLGVSQGGARPLTVSLNVQGSASARYVDADTGQITITSVYTQ
jgi:hypothetical protein